jgi:hypothetical protein
MKMGLGARRFALLAVAMVFIAAVPSLGADDAKDKEVVDEAALKAQQEEQLNALRVLYGAKAAVAEGEKGGDITAKFAEAMKNITFPSAEGKQNSINTAFVSACSAGDMGEVNLLLDNKANINAKLDGQQEGAEGFTALMWAAYGGHKDLVAHLIDKVPRSPRRPRAALRAPRGPAARAPTAFRTRCTSQMPLHCINALQHSAAVAPPSIPPPARAAPDAGLGRRRRCRRARASKTRRRAVTRRSFSRRRAGARSSLTCCSRRARTSRLRARTAAPRSSTPRRRASARSAPRRAAPPGSTAGSGMELLRGRSRSTKLSLCVARCRRRIPLWPLTPLPPKQGG